MPVVLARSVVPVEAEGVHVAVGSLRQRQPARGRMRDVVKVDRLVLVGARNALDGDVEHARDGDGSTHPALLDGDRLCLGAPKATDQWTKRGHWATALTTRDRGECLALLDRGPLVYD